MGVYKINSSFKKSLLVNAYPDDPWLLYCSKDQISIGKLSCRKARARNLGPGLPKLLILGINPLWGN